MLEISKNFADIKFGESNFANGLSSIPGSSRARQLLKDLQIFYDRYTSFFVGTNDFYLRLAVLDTTNVLLFFPFQAPVAQAHSLSSNSLFIVMIKYC